MQDANDLIDAFVVNRIYLDDQSEADYTQLPEYRVSCQKKNEDRYVRDWGAIFFQLFIVNLQIVYVTRKNQINPMVQKSLKSVQKI